MHDHESLFDIVRFQSRSSRRFLVLDHTRADAGTGTGVPGTSSREKPARPPQSDVLFEARPRCGTEAAGVGLGTRTITGLILVLVVTGTSTK